MRQYAIKQTAEFSEELKSICLGNPEIMKKLRSGLTIAQNNDEKRNIKAGDMLIFVKAGDEFEEAVKKYAYWNN